MAVMRDKLVSILAVSLLAIPAMAAAETLVQVKLEGVVLAPVRIDGKSWDGDSIAKREGARFSKAASTYAAMTGDPYVGIAAVILAATSSSIPSSARPDAHGAIELFVDGEPAGSFDLKIIPNTMTPQWSSIHWDHVPHAKDVRLRLELLDSDTKTKSEPIGSVMLNADHIQQALVAKRVIAVPVLDQSSNQIVAVKISAMPMPATSAPPANGTKPAPADSSQTSTEQVVSPAASPSDNHSPDATLTKIHRDYMPGVKRCYRNYLKKAKVQGKVLLSFSVNETGRTVNGRASQFPATEVNECITRLMQTWRFPIPRDKNNAPTRSSFGIGIDLMLN